MSPPEPLSSSNRKLADCPPRPNCICSVASDPRRRIEPFQLGEEDPAAALRRLRAILEGIPRTTIVTGDERYLRAEVTSAVLRFVDDVEFLIDQSQRVIHCRSAARLGRYDFGVNRRRLERIRAAFAQRTSGEK